MLRSCAPALPRELWDQIFEESHTLRDAIAWQAATGVHAGPDDFRRLIARRAPSVLKIIPDPQAHTLWPGPSGPAADVADVCIDLTPLCQPVFSCAPGSIVNIAHVGPLFEAALFMHDFAQASPVTTQLVRFASEAWVMGMVDLSEARPLASYRQSPTAARLFEGTLLEFPIFVRAQPPNKPTAHAPRHAS